MIDEYKKYFKDNPNNYWFKRKVFGWGWTPVKWQSWLVVLGYVIFALLLAFNFNETDSFDGLIFNFLLPLVILSAVLIFICYKKGESPKWQWGLPNEETLESKK